jgi:hypothetical protein
MKGDERHAMVNICLKVGGTPPPAVTAFRAHDASQANILLSEIFSVIELLLRIELLYKRDYRGYTDRYAPREGGTPKLQETPFSISFGRRYSRVALSWVGSGALGGGLISLGPCSSAHQDPRASRLVAS